MMTNETGFFYNVDIFSTAGPKLQSEGHFDKFIIYLWERVNSKLDLGLTKDIL